MEILEAEIYKHYMDVLGVDGALLMELRPTFDGMAPGTRTVRLADIINNYDAFCFDGYGTLYNRGSFVYPGAAEWYRLLRSAGKELRLVTNAASDVSQVLAADAAKRGFDFTENETISSGSLLTDLAAVLREQGTASDGTSAKLQLQEVFYIGRESGLNVLAANGIKAVDDPREPVVAISSAKDTPETYAKAVEILRRPGAVLLVLNSDAWAPKVDGSREPVSGTLCERLRRDSACEKNGGNGCTTFYLGKPFPEIWYKVRKSLASDARVLMIGDTLGTDVLGAKIAGFDSALVVGRNEPAAELDADEKLLGIRPDFYLLAE